MPLVSRNLKVYAEKTSLHGVPDLVFATKKVSIAAWSIVMVTAFVLCTIQITSLVRSYIGEEVGTEIQTWAPTEIPSLTMCPKSYLFHENTMKNLGIPNTTNGVVEAKVINSFMDSYLPFGAQLMAVMDVSEGVQVMTRDTSKFKAAAHAAAAKYNVHSKYGGSLEEFMKENSYSAVEFFEDVTVTPLTVDGVLMSSELTWFGLCYVVRIQRQVSLMQLRYLQVDLKLKEIPTPDTSHLEDLLPPEDIPVYEETGIEVSLMRVGGRSYEGLMGYPVASFQPRNEYYVDIVPNRIERKNLRRRKCGSYAFEEQLFCIINQRRSTCTTCDLLFPKENLSPDLSECNYLAGDQICMMTILENLNHTVVESSSDGYRHCPYPCQSEDAMVSVGAPRAAETNHSIIHVTFRQISQSTMMREYLLVGTEQMLSNLGGSMGLFFGASVLSIFQALHFLIETRFCRKPAKVEDEEVNKENDAEKR